MGAKTKLLGKASDGLLRTGEEPLAVVRAMKPGQLKRSAVAGGIGGLVGAALAHKLDKASEAAGVVELPRMVLALTGERMLVFTQSALTAKAKELRFEFPVADFAAVEAGEGKVLGMKVVPLAFQLRDGDTFAVEVPFVDRAEAHRLAEVLAGLITP